METELRKRCLFAVLALGVLVSSARAQGQFDFERPPIDYPNQPAQDAIAALQRKLDTGDAKLDFTGDHGYLPAVLKLLEIPESSQTLVFSKTSLQLHAIHPRRPRALYFNDDVYVGWVQNGDIELSAVDPKLGAVFYTLTQEETDRPKFVRDKGQCLICHASTRTQNVPGYLMRSVFSNAEGQPQLGSGTFISDDHSPVSERWGGWYVTGSHGAMRHMGNVIATDANQAENIDREAGANVTDLSKRFNVSAYLRPTSDIVALMLLGHQSQAHNAMTAASYECQMATHYDGIMNEALKRPVGTRSESTDRRIASAGDKLLKRLLFADEFALTAPVAGNSSFATEFGAFGPRDRQGRSLRDFDLKTRLFKYPCSYLIYSPSFDALPAPMKSYVAGRLRDILHGRDQSPEFVRLSPDDRRAILEILSDTKPGLFGDDGDSNAARTSNGN